MALVVNILANYVFLIQLNTGIKGLACAFILSNLSKCCVFHIWIWYTEFEKDLNQPIFSDDSLDHLWPQCVLSLQSASMTVWARWAVEMISIISAFVGDDVLAAQTILKGISTAFFNIPMGLSTASVILVGSNIAQGKIKLAKEYSMRNLEIAAIWGVLVAIILLSFETSLVEIFTEIENIKALCFKAFYQFTLFVVGEVIEGSFAGIIRGLGF